MTCPCRNKPTANANNAATNTINSTNTADSEAPPPADRYVSFIGLDCDAKAARLMALLRRTIDQPRHSNAFWEYFKKKAAGGSGPRPDDLFLIHSNLNQIRELFEQYADDEALALLDHIEEACC